MLKHTATIGAGIIFLVVLGVGYQSLKTWCSFEGPLPKLETASPEGERAKPSAIFDLRVAEPNKIAGRYYAEKVDKEDWGHKFFCDIKIGEVLLAIFTLYLVFYTARLYWATDKLTEADRPHVLVDRYSLTGLRNTDPSVATVNVDYAFRNHGKSPAFCNMLTVDVLHVKSGDVPNKPTYIHRKPNFLILGPGVFMGPISGAQLTIPFTLAERQDVVTGNAKLYVSGRIEYKDALGKPHISSFLYLLRLGANEAQDFYEAVGPRSYWTYT
jgi:hypothetical protein